MRRFSARVRRRLGLEEGLDRADAVDGHGAAMDAPQSTELLELVEVAPDRGGGDAQLGAQVLDPHRVARAHDLAQALAALGGEGDDVGARPIRNAHERCPFEHE